MKSQSSRGSALRWGSVWVAAVVAAAWSGFAATRAVQTARIFLLPSAIFLLYYCLKIHAWGYPDAMSSWALFLRLWASHWRVAAVSATAIALCLMERETVAFAVPPLGMLAVYLLGPAVLWVTKKMNTAFFTERHYLYYWTAAPIACGTLSFALACPRAPTRRRAAARRRGGGDAAVRPPHRGCPPAHRPGGDNRVAAVARRRRDPRRPAEAARGAPGAREAARVLPRERAVHRGAPETVPVVRDGPR